MLINISSDYGSKGYWFVGGFFQGDFLCLHISLSCLRILKLVMVAGVVDLHYSHLYFSASLSASLSAPLSELSI